MNYSKEATSRYLRRKFRLIDKLKKEENELKNLDVIRPIFLFLIRRKKQSHIETIDKISSGFEATVYERCIGLISEVREKKKKLCPIKNSRFHKHANLLLNNLKTYAYLHTYKDTITTLCIQKKLNGNNDVCRHILSYL